MSRDFVDTDVLIQSREARSLQNIIDTEGMDAFLALEERHVLEFECRNCIVATGGSVVYSKPAMQHLRRDGLLVHLDLPLQALEQRLTDSGSRGLVIAPGQTLADLYNERQPLYGHFADQTLHCRNLNHQQTVERLLQIVSQFLAVPPRQCRACPSKCH